MQEAPSLFQTPEEISSAIAAFQIPGVGLRAMRTIRKLLNAVLATPEGSRIADVICAKMNSGRSTYQRALAVLRGLEPSPLIVVARSGAPSLFKFEPQVLHLYRYPSQLTGRPPNKLGGVSVNWEASQLTQSVSRNSDRPTGRPTSCAPLDQSSDKNLDLEARKDEKRRDWDALIGHRLTANDLGNLSVLTKLYRMALADGRAQDGDAGLFLFVAYAQCACRLAKRSPKGLFYSAVYGKSHLAPSKADEDAANDLIAGPKRGPVSEFTTAALGKAFEADDAPPRIAPPRRTPAEQQLELRKRLERSREQLTHI